MFLLRKLATDSAVDVLAHEVSAALLLKTLSQTLQRKPRTGHSSVLPYASLVALWKKGDFATLARAAKIRSPHHRWYAYLAAMLMQEAQATSFNTLKFPPGRVDTTSSAGRGHMILTPESKR
jgi:hypothetical protein